MAIDWNMGHSTSGPSENINMKLSELPLSQSASVKIEEMKMTTGGYIVATVTSEELEGNTLWLSGKFGLQNGAYSLQQLVGSSDESDYVGEFFVSKIPSDKSTSGYRYEWTR